MSDEQRLIDTNILVHAYVVADDRKHTIAKHIIQKIWNEGGGVTTLQNICEFFNVDGLVKSLKNRIIVIPVKTGIQCFQTVKIKMDSRLRGNDDFLRVHQCCNEKNKTSNTVAKGRNYR